MKAADKGIPVRTAVVTVEVTVKRDRGQLKFSSDTYKTTVSENKKVGDEVARTYASPGVSTIH